MRAQDERASSLCEKGSPWVSAEMFAVGQRAGRMRPIAACLQQPTPCSVRVCVRDPPTGNAPRSAALASLIPRSR